MQSLGAIEPTPEPYQSGPFVVMAIDLDVDWESPERIGAHERLNPERSRAIYVDTTRRLGG